VCTEEEVRVSHEELVALTMRIHPLFGEVRKTRYYFVWKNQVFELDVFENLDGLMVMELEMLSLSDVVELPDFLAGNLRKVTGDKAYSNYELARRLGTKPATRLGKGPFDKDKQWKSPY
jgi:CYTH domain-containing protein